MDSRMNRRSPFWNGVLAGAGAVCVSPALMAEPGQPPADAGAAPARAVVTKMPIVIEEVQGTVSYRQSEDGRWTPAKKGVVLQEGAEFQTSIGSNVRIRVGAAQVFVIDRLGRVKVAKAINDSKAEVTRINVDYGRITFDVNSTNFANDVQIQAPDMTLAVKGTSGGVEASPGFPTAAFGAVANKGRIEVAFADGARPTLNRNEKIDSKKSDPAANQSDKSFVDTSNASARDTDETYVVERSIGGGEPVGSTLGTKAAPNQVVKSTGMLDHLPTGRNPTGR